MHGWRKWLVRSFSLTSPTCLSCQLTFRLVGPSRAATICGMTATFLLVHQQHSPPHTVFCDYQKPVSTGGMLVPPAIPVHRIGLQVVEFTATRYTDNSPWLSTNCCSRSEFRHENSRQGEGSVIPIAHHNAVLNQHTPRSYLGAYHCQSTSFLKFVFLISTEALIWLSKRIRPGYQTHFIPWAKQHSWRLPGAGSDII